MDILIRFLIFLFILNAVTVGPLLYEFFTHWKHITFKDYIEYLDDHKEREFTRILLFFEKFALIIIILLVIAKYIIFGFISWEDVFKYIQAHQNG